MTKSDREMWAGGNKLYLGEDNILYVTIVGEDDEKTATSIKEASFKLINMVERKVSVLIDVDKAGKASPEARKIWRELSEHDKFGKIALVGLHRVARVLASFVINVSRKQDFRFFKTKEEALVWLNE